MSHHRRLVAIWLVASAIAVPLILLVLGKHLPPGTMSSEAKDQRDANTRLTALVAPVVLIVLIGFGYSLVAFRARGSDGDGKPIFGHARTQAVWLVATSAIVIGLAAWASWTLIVSSHGAGGGQGPDPIALPKDHGQALQVQVIGQQWNWTYRFPSFAGLETAHLELPVGTDVELHVTSLDVTHSFWAYELGVKADAFSIRCSELCGLWHGHMFQTGEIVTPQAFAAWIASERMPELPNLRYLPPYGKTYYPEPLRRAG